MLKLSIVRFFPVLWMPLLAILLLGCSSDWPKETGTAVVEGTLTLDGSPVDKGLVVFIPENLHTTRQEVMPMAYGRTDAAGNFKLAYSDGNRQLLAGKYSVIISKSRTPDDDEAAASRWSSALLPDSVANLASFDEDQELIPARYNESSTLVFEIRRSNETLDCQFDLTTADPLLRASSMDGSTESNN